VAQWGAAQVEVVKNQWERAARAPIKEELMKGNALNISQAGALLTVQEAAAQLGLKPKTLRQWIWRREIEYLKLGAGSKSSVRIRPETIAKILEQSVIPALESR